MRDKFLLTDRRLVIYAILYANQPLTYEDIYFMLGICGGRGFSGQVIYRKAIKDLVSQGFLREEKVPYSIYLNDEDHIWNVELKTQVAQPLLYINEDKLI